MRWGAKLLNRGLIPASRPVRLQCEDSEIGYNQLIRKRGNNYGDR